MRTPRSWSGAFEGKRRVERSGRDVVERRPTVAPDPAPDRQPALGVLVEVARVRRWPRVPYTAWQASSGSPTSTSGGAQISGSHWLSTYPRESRPSADTWAAHQASQNLVIAAAPRPATTVALRTRGWPPCYAAPGYQGCCSLRHQARHSGVRVLDACRLASFPRPA